MANLAGGLLKDEYVDLADMSTSFASPLPNRRSAPRAKVSTDLAELPPPLPAAVTVAPLFPTRRRPSSPPAPAPAPLPSDLSPQQAAPDPIPTPSPTSDATEEGDEAEPLDNTILEDTPTKPAASAPPLDPSQIALINTPGRTHKARVRVTHEVERIVVTALISKPLRCLISYLVTFLDEDVGYYGSSHHAWKHI
jgi:hypothetical protein